MRTFVYFFRTWDSGKIKIGFTSNLSRRLDQLESACGERLDQVYAFVGDRDMEQMLHRHFAEERLHGEWFEPSGRLLKFLNWARSEALKKLDPEFREMFGHLYEEKLT